MIVAEMMFLIVSQLHWNNILLLNANDEGTIHLIHELNNFGRPITTVEQASMESYPWPERMDMKPRIDGFLMMAEYQSNLTGIFRFLKEMHLLVPMQPWIVGVEGYLCLAEILPSFSEGDRVVVIGDNISTSNDILKDKRDEIFHDYAEDAYEGVSVRALRSLGNGSIEFERIYFQNLSSVEEIFGAPFRNFRGRTLRISSLGSPPIRINPPKGEIRWHGYIFRIINTLADFFNFTYTVKEADNRLYGLAQEDGSWTGIFGELINKNVDIGTGDLSWTLERSLVVDLTKPVFPETVTFIYRAPDFYSRTWILFQGIELKVWIGLVSATVAAFASYFLGLSLHRIWSNINKSPSSICIQSADESISSLYRALLGKGVIHVPFPTSCRTVLGAWLVGSLILSALYGGGLTSKLSLHKSPKPADSIKELLKRHPDALLAVNNNSQIHGVYKMLMKQSQMWNKVWKKNMEKNVIPGSSRIHDTMTRVHNSSNSKAPYVWIAERSMLVKLMRNYSADPVICDLYVGKDDIIRSDWSIALQRDSPFLAQFNELITRMERFGLLERWRREYWNPATGFCHPNDGLNQTAETPITLDDTRAVFIVLAIGWALGIVTFIAERRCHH